MVDCFFTWQKIKRGSQNCVKAIWIRKSEEECVYNCSSPYKNLGEKNTWPTFNLITQLPVFYCLNKVKFITIRCLKILQHNHSAEQMFTKAYKRDMNMQCIHSVAANYNDCQPQLIGIHHPHYSVQSSFFLQINPDKCYFPRWQKRL